MPPSRAPKDDKAIASKLHTFKFAHKKISCCYHKSFPPYNPLPADRQYQQPPHTMMVMCLLLHQDCMVLRRVCNARARLAALKGLESGARRACTTSDANACQGACAALSAGSLPGNLSRALTKVYVRVSTWLHLHTVAPFSVHCIQADRQGHGCDHILAARQA